MSARYKPDFTQTQTPSPGCYSLLSKHWRRSCCSCGQADQSWLLLLQISNSETQVQAPPALKEGLILSRGNPGAWDSAAVGNPVVGLLAQLLHTTAPTHTHHTPCGLDHVCMISTDQCIVNSFHPIDMLSTIATAYTRHEGGVDVEASLEGRQAGRQECGVWLTCCCNPCQALMYICPCASSHVISPCTARLCLRIDPYRGQVQDWWTHSTPGWPASTCL